MSAGESRSHPPALLKRTLRTLREETTLKSGDRILVGVSGGGDSNALLHVMAMLRTRLGFTLRAHGVDHGLRAEARAELDLAAQLADSLSVPFERSCLNLARGGNLQARAREARYGALDAAAARFDARWVATAHHADDRAETVLLRLLRGTGPRGLRPLPAESPGRLRPLIRSDRRAIEAHLNRHDIAFASDPSNHSRRFLRTRVRHELLPLMEDLVPGAARRLNQLADDFETMAEDDALAAREEPGCSVNTAQRRQIRRARKLNQSSAEVWLPGGVSVRVDPKSGRLVPSVDSTAQRNPQKPDEAPTKHRR